MSEKVKLIKELREVAQDHAHGVGYLAGLLRRGAAAIRDTHAGAEALESQRAEQWQLRRDAEARCDTQAAAIAELRAENGRLREALECVKQAGFDCGNDGWGVIHLTNDDWQIVLAASTGQGQGG